MVRRNPPTPNVACERCETMSTESNSPLAKKKTKTNPVGPGTINLSVNMPKKLHKALKRLAKTEGVSLGELCRDILTKGAGVYYIPDPVRVRLPIEELDGPRH